MRSVEEWKTVLRAALRDALRARDQTALSVMRDTLAAIDNAEAPDLSHAPAAQSTVIAGATDGIGTGDIPRRELSPADVIVIVEREIKDRTESAASYAALGRQSEADELDRQAGVLQSLLRDSLA